MLPGHRSHLFLLLAVLALAPAALPARAQLLGGMQGGGLPVAVPNRPTLPAAVPRRARGLPEAATDALSEVRKPALTRLLRRHRDVLDSDPAGAPVIRSEVVAIDPTDAALQRALAAGFRISDERMLDILGLRLVVLHAPDGTGTRAALRQLRQLDPGGSYDFNHLYFGSGGATVGDGQVQAPAAGPGTPAIRVGLIDSGVAHDHPALAGVDIKTWGCNGAPVADAHGTAVASLLVGAAEGAAPSGHTLYAADIYCGRPTGGAVTGYAQAMAWLAQERVGVINLSLVGPHNALLQRATEALAARGHVLVAAVGNDGPAAPPLFPAAYPAVIGVTAVDRRNRVLPEAVRGGQVDFAAPGTALRVARPGGGWGAVRGTSFAAPLVARAAAAYAPQSGTGSVERARARLAEQALDLGPAGRDDIYGHGLVDSSPPARPVGSR